MQPLWARYPNPLDKNEVRGSNYGVYDFFKDQSRRPDSLLDADTVTKAMNSMGNTVQIPVLDAENVTISNTRSCTIPTDDETSNLVTLTFTTYSFGFTMAPARHFNNEVSYQALFNKKLMEYLIKLAKTLDTAGKNVLENNKNAYFPSNITNYYAEVAGALQVSQAKRDDFFNQLQAIAEEMDYPGDLNVIGSTSYKPMVNRLRSQGAGNQSNEQFQFPPYTWYNSNRITNGAGIQSTLYMVPDGNVHMVNRNTPDHMMNHKIADFKEWGTSRMPIVDLVMGTYYTKDCGDMKTADGGGSRMAHLERTLVEGFVFDTDVCFITAYNSDTANTFSPILKAEISAT